MPHLWNRDFAITVGSTRIATRSVDSPDASRPILRVSFEIKKDLNLDPNPAKIKLWNLGETSRSAFQAEGAVPVTVEAGYVDQTQLIFSGDLTEAMHSRDSAGSKQKDAAKDIDWITTMEAGDGSRPYRSSRISESFGSGTPIIDVVKKILATMEGLDPGNVLEKIEEGGYRGGVTELSAGISLIKQSTKALEQVLALAGIEFSIQGGRLQALRPDEILGTEGVLLEPATGLVGSPGQGKAGLITGKSLLQGAIAPGKRLEIVSDRLKAAIRVETVTHKGDTWGTQWYSEFEGVIIK